MRVVIAFAGRLAALLALPFLWLSEPFWRIRIAPMLEDRIGHIAANTLVLAKKLQLDGYPPRTTWLLVAWNPANRTLMDMWRQRFVIFESRLAKRLLLEARPILQRTRFYEPLPFENTEHREFALGRPPIAPTPDDDARARAALADMGMAPTDWFVCLSSRDPAYLGQRAGFGNAYATPSIRDCSVATFLDAAEAITARGGFVLRMGAIVDGPLPETGNARIIDYATRHRSDFMDIWLSANCRFFLGCTAGLICVPWVFHRPVGASNFVTLQFAALGGPRTYFMPKKLRRVGGDILSYREAHAMGLFAWGDYGRTKRPEFYVERYLEWVDNSADEIRDLALDMMDMVDGHRPDPETQKLQSLYHEFFAGGPHHSEHAGRLAPRFARRHAALIH